MLESDSIEKSPMNTGIWETFIRSLLWSECISPKFLLKPTSKKDNDFRRWNFREVLGHEVRVLVNGIKALIKRAPSLSLSPFVNKMKSLQFRSPSTDYDDTLILDLACLKYISVIYKPPRLWYLL